MIDAAQADAFAACLRRGGVAIFGADTIYGLACAPDDAAAVDRLYAIKGRRPDKPAAVMFLDADAALAALPELPPRTRAAAQALLPGPVTLLLPNPRRRFPLACTGDAQTLGLRVPELVASAAALAAVTDPILQTSANVAGGAEATTVEQIPPAIHDAADLVLDAGPLAGVASTVVDLRAFETNGEFTVVREGAVSAQRLAATLRSSE